MNTSPSPEEWRQLIADFQNGLLSASALRARAAAMRQLGNDEWENILLPLISAEEEAADFNKGEWNDVFAQIVSGETKPAETPVVPMLQPQKSVAPRRWMSAAAVVLLMAGSYGVFKWYKPDKTLQNPVAGVQPVLPGSDKALLTLPNGKTIVLNEQREGALVSENGVDISLTGGMVVYRQTAAATEGISEISVPRGGKFQLLLADGSKVWLNADSRLRFPGAFNGPERKVELSGEAYFEISPGKAKPFVVTAQGTEVKVLGTSFNMMAYAGEIISTSLLDGSVKVQAAAVEKILKPGMQLNSSDKGVNIAWPDMDEVIAWKNDRFSFSNESIRDIMKKIARWYNVDVVFEGQIPEWSFSGSISRKQQLKVVLDALEKMDDVHFKINNKTITVMKK